MISKYVVEMDKNDIPMNIYLDISKAFDTLVHTILIDKLSHYEINGITLKLNTKFLTDRIQFVEKK